MLTLSIIQVKHYSECNCVYQFTPNQWLRASGSLLPAIARSSITLRLKR